MGNFVVSARKYRPSTFQSVVGQRSITATLKNTLAAAKLGHAYLFTGPRGVGKTTCARIFAKTINCFQLTPEHEPCNECESCTSFNENRSYNIHELDAASNNSVDDIRSITEKVRIKPQLGKYSVYIIDEVHMLSTAAFNAFLKTLEEPPEHAVFILATTEKHKVLPTILSRCQIFDFSRITVEDAADHLAYVARSEGIEADMDALNIIAQKADGGMRDALSMFDQIVTFSGGKITYQSVIENLNVLDYDYYFRVVDELLACNIPGTLLIFNDVLDHGFDGQHFITGLAAHLRDLLVCKDEATLKLLEVGASTRERYRVQAIACPVMWLFRAIEIANTADLNYKAAQNKRLQVELALLHITQLNVRATEQPQAAPSVAQAAPAAAPRPASAPVAAAPAPSPAPAAPAASAPVQTPAAAPASDASARRRSSTSISAMLSQTDSPAAPTSPSSAHAAPVPQGDTPLSQAPLLAAWQAFAAQYVKSPRMQSFFETNKPSVADDHTVEILISNKLQQDSLESQLDQLQSFLRQQLHNARLRILFRMMEATPQQKAVTPEDKFRLLVEKNPRLMLLKNKFNLDF